MSKKQEKIELKVKRQEGSDGKISCIVKTEACNQTNGGVDIRNAAEFEDYLPYM